MGRWRAWGKRRAVGHVWDPCVIRGERKLERENFNITTERERNGGERNKRERESV